MYVIVRRAVIQNAVDEVVRSNSVGLLYFDKQSVKDYATQPELPASVTFCIDLSVTFCVYLSQPHSVLTCHSHVLCLPVTVRFCIDLSQSRSVLTCHSHVLC